MVEKLFFCVPRWNLKKYVAQRVYQRRRKQRGETQTEAKSDRHWSLLGGRDRAASMTSARSLYNRASRCPASTRIITLFVLGVCYLCQRFDRRFGAILCSQQSTQQSQNVRRSSSSSAGEGDQEACGWRGQGEETGRSSQVLRHDQSGDSCAQGMLQSLNFSLFFCRYGAKCYFCLRKTGTE